MELNEEAWRSFVSHDLMAGFTPNQELRILQMFPTYFKPFMEEAGMEILDFKKQFRELEIEINLMNLRIRTLERDRDTYVGKNVKDVHEIKTKLHRLEVETEDELQKVAWRLDEAGKQLMSRESEATTPLTEYAKQMDTI